MLVRTVLLPPLLVGRTVDGSSVPGDLTRVSTDDDATRRPRAAGFLRLGTPSPADQRR